MVVLGTAFLWNGEKQLTVELVVMRVKDSRGNNSRALNETDRRLAGEVCSRCGARIVAEYIGFQAGS